MTPRRAASPVESLLAAREIVVACGPGGVGKTTAAAAVAATAAARSGAKVLVLTVDPARRLADALGVDGIGNAASRVSPSTFTAAGVRPKGELWAAMLDTKQSWDALVRRHAPDRSTADQILANPLYQNITGRFAQSHEYIAMERLYEIHAEGEYDLLVVDTPPTRNALDFLDAPQRMADFFASGLLRWLIAPSRSRLVSLASRPFYQVADRILGTQFLEDVAEFFRLFQSMYDGFVSRAQSVSGLLRDPRTTFMVVTTLETVPALEAARFAEALAERHLHLGLLVANKVLPPSFADPDAEAVAESLQTRSEAVATALSSTLADGLGGVDQVERVLQEVGRSFANFELVARRESELLAEMSRGHSVTVTVPHLSGDVVDVAGLLEIGRHVFDGFAVRADAPTTGLS
ncbi:MAG: oxyanion-translocating ATPase [Acidimicrobiaceae bacterium]|nr:oxyanion-translocating ATPase [Acidimicrobiaceae bacterium]